MAQSKASADHVSLSELVTGAPAKLASLATSDGKSAAGGSGGGLGSGSGGGSGGGDGKKRKRSTGRKNCLAAAVAGVIKLAAADLQPPVMTSLLLAAAGAALEVLAAAVEAAVVATTAVATTEAVAGYTPRAGQRRRNHRSRNTGKDGGSSKARLDLAWRRS